MAELSVSRKNLSKLFTEMQGKKFLIPDYQRPYKWDEEKCETLWEDITNFHASKKDDEEYFLGTIVSYKNNQNVEIIDGQQRITSFFLLLRAFYHKLEGMPEDPRVKGLKNQIAPCIWDVDSISQEVIDRKKIHIESLVATDEDRMVFHNTLETGTTNSEAVDLYSCNYRFFFEQCEDYAKQNPMQWQPLCVTILQRCIILPIECDVQDTALTIFSTLNDRGMPLSDSDIFKAQIYKTKTTEGEKKAFTTSWKELTSICKGASISVDDIFRYYTHVLRAKDRDKSKEVGLRKFYAQKQYSFLREPALVENLIELAKFWLYINSDKKSDELKYELSVDAKKYLHCLSWYPNEFWRYLTSVFFFKTVGLENFNEEFPKFLKSLTAFLLIKFIEKPTVNAIKDDIYARCISIYHENKANLSSAINEDELKQGLSLYSMSKLSRALILLHAYLNSGQNEPLPKTFDIEHIFPRKWQNTNYNGWNEEDAQECLEKFGNKVAIEKKLNIQAGNGYFGNKKKKYAQSKVADVSDLAKLDKNEWAMNDILDREAKFMNTLVQFFSSALTVVDQQQNRV